jgi:hypothetical protein
MVVPGLKLFGSEGFPQAASSMVAAMTKACLTLRTRIFLVILVFPWRVARMID